MFSEGCFVLCEGSYDDNVFSCSVMGFPPAEDAETFRYVTALPSRLSWALQLLSPVAEYDRHAFARTHFVKKKWQDVF